MAKIERIMKARREWKCKRCGKVIAKGQPYLKAEINFGPQIVRCIPCGLAPWEVTSSEYKLAVGEIANRWQDNYEMNDGVHEEITQALQEIMDEEQCKLDNMPESLQEGSIMQERIDNLEGVIYELEAIDTDAIKAQAAEEVMQEQDDYDSEVDYDYETLMSTEGKEDLHIELESKFNELLSDAIEAALEGLEY